MTKQPLVSILTPSYNQAAFIGDALGSVAKQTYPSIEHIVMDGGSTDDTVSVLKAAGATVTWTSEKDRGQGHAVNKAFAISNGGIIGWINSDDALFDTRVVEDVVTYFDVHPDIDVVFGHAARVTAEGRIVRILHVAQFSYRHLLWECFLVQPAVFMRRSAVEDTFLNEEFQFAMDWELWLRLAQTHKFGRINRVLAVDRTHGERKIKTWLAVLDADMEVLGGMYGVARPKDGDLVHRYHVVKSRLAGAIDILRPIAPLAFSGPQDSKWTLLRRQVASRSARWPEEYR